MKEPGGGRGRVSFPFFFSLLFLLLLSPFSSLSSQVIPHGQPAPVVHDSRPVVLPHRQKGDPRDPPSRVRLKIDAGGEPKLLPRRKVEKVFGDGDAPRRRRRLRPRVELEHGLGSHPELVAEVARPPGREPRQQRVAARAVRDARGRARPGERRALEPPGRVGVRQGRAHDLLDAGGELEAARDGVELADDL